MRTSHHALRKGFHFAAFLCFYIPGIVGGKGAICLTSIFSGLALGAFVLVNEFVCWMQRYDTKELNETTQNINID